MPPSSSRLLGVVALATAVAVGGPVTASTAGATDLGLIWPDGEEPVCLAYLYSLSGSGVSAGGITGEGNLDITITGVMIAEDGRVRIEREEAVAQFSGVVVGGIPVPDGLPLSSSAVFAAQSTP